ANVSELYLPHQWTGEGWWQAYVELAAWLEDGASGEPAAYAALARELVGGGHEDLATAIAHALVTGEPPFQPGEEGVPASGARSLLLEDIATLASAAARRLGAEASAASGHELPELSRLAQPSPFAAVRELRGALLAAEAHRASEVYLAGLKRHGGGVASVNGALRWRQGGLQAVAAPATASFDELIGLDEQLTRLRANTEALLGRRGAQNVLLYGPRGSGKSTAVRALLGQYQDSGLRLVELPLGELGDLPELLDGLRGKPQAFVLFVDDLSFEEGDAGYRP